MRLFISILSLLFLFTVAGVTFCVMQEKYSISYAEEELSAPSEEHQEGEEDKVRDIDFLATLEHNFFALAVAEKQQYPSAGKIYISPNRLYDNPPPES